MGSQLDPVTLVGKRVRLVPMSMEHREAFCHIGLDPTLWARTTIRIQTPEEMSAYMQEALDGYAAGTSLPFAIVLQEAGTVVGTTRFHSIASSHFRREIGFTWVGRPWQRTGINTEAKYLLLTHAFEDCECQRIEFKSDVDNEPSCLALEGIGATKEGVLRSFMFSRHAGMRDVALFSIVASEWPRVKARLQQRLTSVA